VGNGFVVDLTAGDTVEDTGTAHVIVEAKSGQVITVPRAWLWYTFQTRIAKKLNQPKPTIIGPGSIN
jgi:hypothetical protein